MNNKGNKAFFLPIQKEIFDKETENEENESINLLYRKFNNYGVGHGSSADWKKNGNSVYEVISEPLPVFKAPNISPDIMINNGKDLLRASMRKLAGIETKDEDIFFELNKLIKHYNIWIKEKENGAPRTGDILFYFYVIWN